MLENSHSWVFSSSESYQRGFCLCSNPYNVGEGQGGIYHQQRLKDGGETVPMVILVMDVVVEGNLGMVTTFCCHNQAKMEVSEAVSALCQCKSPEPSVVVVRRYTISLYTP